MMLRLTREEAEWLRVLLREDILPKARRHYAETVDEDKQFWKLERDRAEAVLGRLREGK